MRPLHTPQQFVDAVRQAGLVDPHRLRAFVAQDPALKIEAARLLEEALIRGELDRGEAPRVTGLPERSARRVLNDLTARGLLASTTPKGRVSLRFPTHSLEVLFPKLLPHT